MKIIKRSIALVITCLLIISCAPTASAYEQFGDYEYYVEDDHVVLTKYLGTETDVVIPATIAGLPVEKLQNTFEHNTTIESVRMPDTLKELWIHAFRNCINLKNVEFGANTSIIGFRSFENTALETVSLPDSLTEIGSRAFMDCHALNNVIIPDSVTVIRPSAFANCSSLSNIKLSNNIEILSVDVFQDCTSLKKIDVPASVKAIYVGAFEGCTSLESFVVPDTIETVGAELFKGCTSLRSVVLPERITVIPDGFLEGCASITSFKIPDNTTTIGANAFKGTSIETINIPDTITKIGERAFYECKNLKEIKIPSSVETIHQEAFYSCSALEKLTIEEGVISLRDRAFSYCRSIKKIELPSTLILDNIGCFAYCFSLEEINIPSGTTILNESLFEGCQSLKAVDIPDGVKTIGKRAFIGCMSLKKIDMTDTVTSCGESCFAGCYDLEEINLSQNVNCISKRQFYACHSLKRIRIPKTAQRIYSDAFYDCVLLRDVYIFNPSIVIDSKCHLGVYPNNMWADTNLAIFGYGGSTAEKYALEKNIKFIDLNVDASQYNTVINLDSDTLKLNKSYSRKIGFSVDNPCGPTRFESTDTSVARVDGDGLVKGVSVGTAYIAVTNGNAVAVVTVNVKESVIDLENEQQNNDYKYYFVEDEKENIYVRITKYIGTKRDVVIPSVIGGHPVKEIDEEAFSEFNEITDIDGNPIEQPIGITSLVIPEGVEKIGSLAFCGCAKLKSIKFPSTLKDVGEALFYWKNYSNTIYGSLNPLSAETVEFPSEQAYLDFVKMSGDSLQYNLPSQNPYKLIIGGKELNKFELADGVTSVPNYLFYNCKSIESVTLPDGLETVGKYSFYGCSALKSINIPASVEDIDAYAFYGCTSLSEITLPEYLKNLRQYALARSGIKAITFPANTLVWSYACANCTKLEKIVINCKAKPDYYYGIFTGCSAVKSIYEGYGVADLNDYQTDYFRGITSKPTGYGYLNGSLIASCRVNGWEFVLLPYPWETPGSEGSDLDPIDIYPDYLYDADTDTYTMTDKEGSNSGEGAYPNAEAWYAKNVVFDFEKEVCLTQWCTQWIYNVENVVVKGNVLDIDNSAFMFCQNTLKTVELSDNVRMITNGAFNGCDRLTTVKGGKGLKKIGLKAFLGCTALSDLSFAESAETIGNSAFSGCTGLSDFKIPDSVKTIGEDAFLNCSGVDEVEIPATVTEIRAHALGYMYNSEQAEYYPIPGFAIVAEKGSAAEKYALENDFKVEYNNHIDPSDTTPKLSASKLTLTAGKVKTLKAYNCTVKTWKSSNSKVVSVKSGKITALKKGTAAITATLTTGKELTCKVTVSTSPKLSKKTVSVKKGKTVSVKITGKAAAVNNVYTNTKYAKVVSKNNAVTIIVKGLKKGTTTLKIKVNGVVLKLKAKVK